MLFSSHSRDSFRLDSSPCVRYISRLTRNSVHCARVHTCVPRRHLRYILCLAVPRLGTLSKLWVFDPTGKIHWHLAHCIVTRLHARFTWIKSRLRSVLARWKKKIGKFIGTVYFVQYLEAGRQGVASMQIVVIEQL